MKIEEVFIDENEAQKYFEELCAGVSKAIQEGLITEEDLNKAYEAWLSKNLNV